MQESGRSDRGAVKYPSCGHGVWSTRHTGSAAFAAPAHHVRRKWLFEVPLEADVACILCTKQAAHEGQKISSASPVVCGCRQTAPDAVRRASPPVLLVFLASMRPERIAPDYNCPHAKTFSAWWLQ